MYHHGCRGLPPAHYCIQIRVAVKESFAPSYRQLVNQASLQRISHIEIGAAVIGCRVVRILIDLRTASATPSGRILIIQKVRPDVVRIKGQSVSESAINLHLQGIVVGNRGAEVSLNRSELRIWGVSLTEGWR